MILSFYLGFTGYKTFKKKGGFLYLNSILLIVFAILNAPDPIWNYCVSKFIQVQSNSLVFLFFAIIINSLHAISILINGINLKARTKNGQQVTKKLTSKKMSLAPKSGFAIASLVLGILSFIPSFGVIFGIIAIIFGCISLSQIKRNNLSGKGLAIAGIILGIIGILFTVAFIGFIFYLEFGAKTGPIADMRLHMSQQVIETDIGKLELYQHKYGIYPNTLSELTNLSYGGVSDNDFYGRICYNVSSDRKSYSIASAGPDRLCGTGDDISWN